jgi:hypothetical protein
MLLSHNRLSSTTKTPQVMSLWGVFMRLGIIGLRIAGGERRKRDSGGIMKALTLLLK